MPMCHAVPLIYDVMSNKKHVIYTTATIRYEFIKFVQDYH